MRGKVRELREALRVYLRESSYAHRGPWKGFYARFSPEAPEPAFPFHTDAARKVWEKAKQNTILYPELRPQQILQRTITDSGVGQTELTPEDVQLLDMAIRWLIDGPAGQRPVIGGAPGGAGGPFRSGGDRFLRTRGAP